MTTQQPEALQCAADLEYSIPRHRIQDAFILAAYKALKMVRTQHARINELESQLAQRFDAADMATAAAQGFRDGVASAALASAPAQAAEPSITLDFKMATDLLGMFCGEPGLVTLQRGDEHCHSGPGLYAWYSDMPEEGAGFLGAEPDDEATPSAPSAPAQPVAQQGVAYAALPEPYCNAHDDADACYPDMFSEQQMRAFADATHALRASHGQAPAETENSVSAQADSVQEDSARLDFLIEQRAYVVSDPDACPGYWLHWAMPDGRTWVQGDEHPTPRAAIDAGRKQGARWKSAVRALTLHI